MKRTSQRLGLTAAVAAGLALVAACGGSSKPAASATTSVKETVNVGVLVDNTGAAASVNKTFVNGFAAGALYAAREGFDVHYIVGDTGTNQATALTVAQKFVTQDHVTAVIASSVVTFAVSNYLTLHKVPVVGIGEDGPEWIGATNMFSVVGALHTTGVARTNGLFFKSQGATNLAIVGYGNSPSSKEAAEATAASAEAAGVKVGYLNVTMDYGTTDVTPIVLAMKAAGIDAFTATVAPNTAFAMVTGLRQQGVNVKVVLMSTGYGGDLLQAGPGATSAAQGMDFLLGAEPLEMNTAATMQFAADLRASGTTGAPTFSMYNGYAAAGLLVAGLKAAGPNPTWPSLITALGTIHAFDAVGLYGSHKLDINDRQNIVDGPDNCIWVTKFQGSTFHLVSGADPICGAAIPGKTVAP
jgi:ABC-type branched-subunit amino acid transport system substrate-binding protein